jgi:asparagine synthase (glutamine-hydrolysing)
MSPPGSAPSGTDLSGADPAVVREALARRDPLPGTGGFAGAVDGRLVRDVLGRRPLFSAAGDPGRWSQDPDTLERPVPVPAGHVRTEDGDERVWSLPDPDLPADDAAVGTLRAALDERLETVGTPGLAVAFSGGVDSALLAARLDAPLYAVGFPESHDLRAAESGARLLGCELRTVELDHATLEAAVPRVADATGRTNAMDVSIALPLVLVAERAAADGRDRLALGQGADELFGGYAKVERAAEDPRVEASTVRGARREVVETLPGQLERDTLALQGAGVEPVTPYLHDSVVAAALGLSNRMLVSPRGDRKLAFRLAARQWLPDRLAFREKTAVQYGSLVARELDRLARQAGFKRRMDDHVGQYVSSLVD